MVTKMTVNGVSTTQKGQEQYETFVVNRRTHKTAVQYDYRHTYWELFSCVRLTLEQCRTKRNEWMKQKQLTH